MGDTPIIPNSWLVYFMENPNLKWMMTGGSLTYGNPLIIQFNSQPS